MAMTATKSKKPRKSKTKATPPARPTPSRLDIPVGPLPLAAYRIGIHCYGTRYWLLAASSPDPWLELNDDDEQAYMHNPLMHQLDALRDVWALLHAEINGTLFSTALGSIQTLRNFAVLISDREAAARAGQNGGIYCSGRVIAPWRELESMVTTALHARADLQPCTELGALLGRWRVELRHPGTEDHEGDRCIWVRRLIVAVRRLPHYLRPPASLLAKIEATDPTSVERLACVANTEPRPITAPTSEIPAASDTAPRTCPVRDFLVEILP